MKTVPFSHFFSLQKYDDELWLMLFAELRDNGVRHLAMSPGWGMRTVEEPGFLSRLETLLKEASLSVKGVHAPFGPQFDLRCCEENLRRDSVELHKKFLRIAGRLDAGVYTMHLGVFQEGTSPAAEFEAACRTLSELIPEAEKNGIVLTLENAEHPGGSRFELRPFAERFASPSFGFCYDSGHANVMDASPESLETLRDMQKDIVCVHLHDNDGTLDLHLPPGRGTVRWNVLLDELCKAPRLSLLQNEVNCPAAGMSVRAVCECFRDLFQNRLELE